MSSMPSYPAKLEIVPLTRLPNATVCVPGSKSITNRALVLAALTSRNGKTCELRGALRSEDTEVMLAALRALGFRVSSDWRLSMTWISREKSQDLIPASCADLFVENSGTTMRFLTAIVGLGRGRYRLDGVPRMRERPIADLLTALRQLGVHAYSQAENGCPPVVVEANGLAGGQVSIRSDVSSQFLSGLLMAAPFAQDDVLIEVEGELVSWPYVTMTMQMMRQWGLAVEMLQGNRFRVTRAPVDDAQEFQIESEVEKGRPSPMFRQPDGFREYEIEPDATAASYFFGAAAVVGGQVGVAGIRMDSLQGDIRFVDLLEEMGCQVVRGEYGVTVNGAPLHGVDADMNDISDTVMTLAAVACFADGPTTIRNVAHIRHKETDRLAALATELRRVGAGVDEFADGLTITPQPLHGAEIETYNDHRMAMSMALIGLKVPGVVIKNPGCVAKTYPDFFADLEKLR
jgi:3-phosphoshikimate 1-carboxyvinyltransferase